MMTSINNIVSRKRTRPLAKQVTMSSLPFVALALLLLVSQATAFAGTSALTSEAPLLSNDSANLENIVDAEYEDDMEEWEYDDEEEWEEYDENEEYDDEEYEYEDDWSPEQYEEMDRLFEEYLQEIANRYGDDWEEKFDLVVDKEEIYEQYLEFEERKEEEAEERRQMIEASHVALLQHKNNNNNVRFVVEEFYPVINSTEQAFLALPTIGKGISSDLPSRTHMVVLNIDNKNHANTKSNGQECQTTTTIVTTQGGNTHTVVGSI